MSVSRVLALWALLAATACTDKPAARPPEQKELRAQEAKEVEAELAQQPEKAAPEPGLVASPAEGSPPSAAQLPVPEDFQAETAATIMRANYLGELDKLETELRADEN